MLYIECQHHLWMVEDKRMVGCGRLSPSPNFEKSELQRRFGARENQGKTEGKQRTWEEEDKKVDCDGQRMSWGRARRRLEGEGEEGRGKVLFWWRQRTQNNLINLVLFQPLFKTYHNVFERRTTSNKREPEQPSRDKRSKLNSKTKEKEDQEWRYFLYHAKKGWIEKERM